MARFTKNDKSTPYGSKKTLIQSTDNGTVVSSVRVKPVRSLGSRGRNATAPFKPANAGGAQLKAAQRMTVKERQIASSPRGRAKTAPKSK